MSAPELRGRAVGLDIGGSKVHGVLVDDGRVLAEVRGPVGRGADAVLDAAASAVRGLVPDGPLPLVGVGVPGVVDGRAGTVAHAVNLGIDGPVALAAGLAQRLGTDVVLENDLDAAALGAAHLLALEPDLAYLASGTGLAAGLVLDGRLRRGPRGGAGEIGHLRHDPDGPACACGRRGCLELYASGSALDAAWPSTDGTPSPILVFAAAARGDAAAVAVRDRFVDALAAAVEVLVLATGVQHVVLAGGVAGVGEPLLDAVRDVLTARTSSSSFLVTLGLPDRVVLGPGGAVAPVGAALAALTAHASPPTEDDPTRPTPRTDPPGGPPTSPDDPTAGDPPDATTSPHHPAAAGTTTGGAPRWRS